MEPFRGEKAHTGNWRWKPASSAASFFPPFGRSQIYPDDTRECTGKRKGVELEKREKERRAGLSEVKKYSWGSTSREETILFSGENSRARQVLRTERDEANAPVTATNYASTELNLKDRRRECGGEKRGGTIRARRTRDMIYDARRDSVFATTKFRHRDARRRGLAIRMDRQVEIAGDDISVGLILSAMLDNRDANNYEDWCGLVDAAD